MFESKGKLKRDLGPRDKGSTLIWVRHPKFIEKLHQFHCWGELANREGPWQTLKHSVEMSGGLHPRWKSEARVEKNYKNWKSNFFKVRFTGVNLCITKLIILSVHFQDFNKCIQLCNPYFNQHKESFLYSKQFSHVLFQSTPHLFIPA